jgi:hypothetical protein
MTSTDFGSNYVSREQLAKQLGERLRGRAFSEHALWAWERDGKGPPVTRVGRGVFYSIASVERWLRSQEKAERAA